MAQQNIDIVGESLDSTRDVDERPKLQRISHFLSSLPYETQPRKKVKLPGRDKKVCITSWWQFPSSILFGL